MKKTFNLEELKQYIAENKFKNEDRIFCSDEPNYIFIFADEIKPFSLENFIGYYREGNELFGDCTLAECIKDENCIFTLEPLNPKDMIS